jgi:nucleoside-diphosphate-sugar epimerase
MIRMNKENEKAHVIFGTGPLGMALMRELKSRGIQSIRMVNRNGKIAASDSVEVIQGDGAQESIAREICKDAAVVYHCAQPGYTVWPQQFPALTKGIMVGAAASGAKLIYGDNLYMYGPVNVPLTEQLPYKAKDRKGITRANMAEELLNAHRNSKVRVAIGRASNFYGPGALQSSLGERVFGFALKGKPISLLGNIDVPHTYTYINDFAKGLATLGQEERALGEVWHIPSAETITTRQMLQILFDELGSTRKISLLSRRMASMIALFHPMMREIKEVFYEFEAPYIVDHSKYAQAFGSQTTPHREAIKQTLHWYKNLLEG